MITKFQRLFNNSQTNAIDYKIYMPIYCVSVQVLYPTSKMELDIYYKICMQVQLRVAKQISGLLKNSFIKK